MKKLDKTQKIFFMLSIVFFIFLLINIFGLKNADSVKAAGNYLLSGTGPTPTGIGGTAPTYTPTPTDIGPTGPVSTPTLTLTPTVTQAPTPTYTPTPTVTLVPTATPTFIPTPTTVPPDTTLPVVTITNPLNGSSVIKNTSVTISANASDNVGVTQVKFYVQNVLLCTDLASPWLCSWKVPKTPKATYQIKAEAYDAAGNIGTNTITVKEGR